MMCQTLRFASALLFLVPLLVAQADHVPIEITSFDGQVLKGVIDMPKGKAGEVRRAIVLVHGSGSQSMDGDLTAVTKAGEKNPFFAEVGAALAKSGFAVVRYNKRSYQLQLDAKADPAVARSERVKGFMNDPLLCLVEDAKAAVALAGKRFPKASVHVLGHSQGTYVAVQVAEQSAAVKGIALIGFAATPMSFLQFEQTVYRPLRLFRRIDTNRDEKLDEKELSTEAARMVQRQARALDGDGDGVISRIEFQAASMASLVLREPFAGAYLKREATYPRVADVLKATKIPVVFFQGLLDNQTIAYQAKAVELINKQVWRKENLHFHWFPKLGHALDPRDDYDDVVYRRIDPGAKTRLVEVLSAVFR